MEDNEVQFVLTGCTHNRDRGFVHVRVHIGVGKGGGAGGAGGGGAGGPPNNLRGGGGNTPFAPPPPPK